MYLYIYIYMYICIYVNVYICIYVYVYTVIYTYIYIHIYICYVTKICFQHLMASSMMPEKKRGKKRVPGFDETVFRV